jgi:DNA-binding beta-propeller fold protein YncE
MSIGTPGTGSGELTWPVDVAVDVAGRLFVADGGNCRVQRFGPTGSFEFAFGSSGSGDGQFTSMMGIVADRDGFVYASDVFHMTGAGRVQKFSADGVYDSQWSPYASAPGAPPLVQGLALDRGGDIYLADQGQRCIQRFTAAGVFVQQYGGAGELEDPIGVGIDRDGNVFVADFAADRIVKFAPTGEWLLQWQLQDDGSGLRRGPSDVVIDDLGRVYVVAFERPGVLMYDRAGNFLGQWGGEGTAPGQFRHPTGACVGGDGALYVADRDNDRIQVYAPLPVPSRRTSWSRVKSLFR